MPEPNKPRVGYLGLCDVLADVSCSEAVLIHEAVNAFAERYVEYVATFEGDGVSMAASTARARLERLRALTARLDACFAHFNETKPEDES